MENPFINMGNTGGITKIETVTGEVVGSEVKEESGENRGNKSEESIKADISAGPPFPTHRGSLTPREEEIKREVVVPSNAENQGQTIQRADGTTTTADRPLETAHYISGTRMMLTDSQKTQYDTLLRELGEIQDGRALADIPLSSTYWGKKKELDAFSANLKR